MRFIPEKSEIFEIPFPKETVIEKLRIETEIYKKTESFRLGRKLRGFVHADDFNVSLNIPDPGRYLPVVAGGVTDSINGCVVRLKYRLTTQTKRSLIIWLSITFILTVFFIAGYGRWIYGLITFSMGLVQYILTRKNFLLQVKRTSRVLNNILMSGRKMKNRD